MAAQYIFQDMINRRQVADRFLVDSAATSAEEIGACAPADRSPHRESCGEETAESGLSEV